MDQVGPRVPACDKTHADKYRMPGEGFRESQNRVAAALKDDDEHYQELRSILLDMRYMFAGRIQASMGTGKHVTPFNCYVSGPIKDSLCATGGIMDRAKEAAATMRMGGGIGYDFSTLRPRGNNIRSLQSKASGPVSFMGIYDSVCRTIASAGHRRGAQMGVLRIDHPDVMEFIRAKQNKTDLLGFNISLAVTDEFMRAVKADQDFTLRWGGQDYETLRARDLWEAVMRSTWDWAEPGVLFIDRVNEMNNLRYCETIAATNPCVTGDTTLLTREGPVRIDSVLGKKVDIWNGWEWSSNVTPFSTGLNPVMVVHVSTNEHVRCTPYHQFIMHDGSRKEARDLKVGDRLADGIMPDGMVCKSNVQVTYVHDYNGQHSEETFCVTEPLRHAAVFNGILTGQCAEQPLPPFGACLLGSFNLAKYIRSGIEGIYFDSGQFREDIFPVVRAMDNVTDKAMYPLDEQRDEALGKRRMGIGVTGAANAGEALGYPYGSEGFCNWLGSVLAFLRDEAYLASTQLAKRRGPFEKYDRDRFMDSAFVKTLPDYVQQAIYDRGIRNSHLLSIAPTGTISLCADNVSSGIEPVFAYETKRPIIEFGETRWETLEDYGVREFGVRGKRSHEVTAEEHIRVLATAQQYVDSSVSKTCNVNPNMPWEDFKGLYMTAWEKKCKGCTTYTPGQEREALLTAQDEATPHHALRDEAAESACRYDPETGTRTCDN